MAEEPLPNSITEGATAPSSAAATSEDRKAARALDALDVKGGGEESSSTTNTKKNDSNLTALNNAIKNLSIVSETSTVEKKAAAKKDEVVKKPLIKVDAADVTLVADQLDITKIKATELLRAHDADATKTMLAWVTAS